MRKSGFCTRGLQRNETAYPVENYIETLISISHRNSSTCAVIMGNYQSINVGGRPIKTNAQLSNDIILCYKRRYITLVSYQVNGACGEKALSLDISIMNQPLIYMYVRTYVYSEMTIKIKINDMCGIIIINNNYVHNFLVIMYC